MTNNHSPSPYRRLNRQAPRPERIRGLRSNRITGVPGYAYGDEVTHRDNLVML
jgi:glutamate 5-kinase (EC 2.7.2.11)